MIAIATFICSEERLAGFVIASACAVKVESAKSGSAIGVEGCVSGTISIDVGIAVESSIARNGTIAVLSGRGSSADSVIASESSITDIIGIAAISGVGEIGASIVVAGEALSSSRETVRARLAGGTKVVGVTGTAVTDESDGTAASSIVFQAGGRGLSP